MIAYRRECQHQNRFAGPAAAGEAVGHESGADQENMNQINPTGLACTVVSVEAIQVIQSDQGTQNGNGGAGNPVVCGTGANQEKRGAQNE